MNGTKWVALSGLNSQTVPSPGLPPWAKIERRFAANRFLGKLLHHRSFAPRDTALGAGKKPTSPAFVILHMVNCCSVCLQILSSEGSIDANKKRKCKALSDDRFLALCNRLSLFRIQGCGKTTSLFLDNLVIERYMAATDGHVLPVNADRISTPWKPGVPQR